MLVDHGLCNPFRLSANVLVVEPENDAVKVRPVDVMGMPVALTEAWTVRDVICVSLSGMEKLDV